MEPWLARVSWLDWLLLGVLALSVVVGLWRGLVFELISLAGWILAWLVALHGAEAIGGLLGAGAPGSALRSGVGFVVGFVGTLIVCALLARLAKSLVNATPLSVLDRMLGAGFGLLRGVLLLLALVTVVNWTPMAQAAWWRASEAVTWLARLERGLQPWLPPDLLRRASA